jgi:hypothetical protein
MPGLEKADLKKMLRMSQQHGPMNMAFAIGGDGKAIIQIEKIKQPRAIERAIKTDAPDSKNHRFGTVFIDPDQPKLAQFIVNKAGGGLARKLIVQLKGTGFNKVRLLTEDGAVCEEDEGEEEEILGETGDQRDMQSGEQEPAASSPPGIPAPAEPDGGGAEANSSGPENQASATDAGGQLNPQTLAGELTGLVKQMLAVIAADPSQKAALAELATDAQASLKSGDLRQASAAMDVLREALNNAGSASTQPSPDTVAESAPTIDASERQEADPNVSAAPDTGAADAGTIPAGDTVSSSASTQDRGSLTSTLTDLVKRMLPIIAADPSQRDALSGIAQQAQAGIKGGDLDTAADHIKGLRALIDGWTPNNVMPNGASSGAAAPPAAPDSSAQPQADPAAATAIAKARTVWVATRQKVEGDLGKLHATFSTAFKGHEQEEQISKAFRERVETVLNTLDEELSETLDGVNNAQDPSERARLVTQAHTLLQKYRQHLATDPTIAALDTNPFVPLSVGKTVNATIDALSRSIR